MIPTKGTDSVDDFIDFLQRLAIHELVEFLKVGLDDCIIEAVDSLQVSNGTSWTLCVGKAWLLGG